MDIVHCLDDNYVPMCGVAIESLCSNNKDYDINYHIISTSLSNNNKKALSDIVFKYGKQIQFYDVDSNILSDCVIRPGDHVSLAAYLRILIPKILSKTILQVLYLDCDLVVCGDLSELFTLDLSDYALAGVYDGATNDFRTYNRLHYSSDFGYFNSGVLLFNLDYWRTNNTTEEIFRFIAENPEKLLFWDQDAINATLAGKIKRLPFKYNMTDPFYMINLNLRQEYLDEIKHFLATPTILHFATSAKPWLSKDAPHPLKEKFYYYLNQTKWAGIFPLKRSVIARIKSKIRKTIEKRLNITKDYMYLSNSELDGG